MDQQTPHLWADCWETATAPPTSRCISHIRIHNWLVVLTILKKISQWGKLSHILWRIKTMFQTTNQIRIHKAPKFKGAHDFDGTWVHPTNGSAPWRGEESTWPSASGQRLRPGFMPVFQYFCVRIRTVDSTFWHPSGRTRMYLYFLFPDVPMSNQYLYPSNPFPTSEDPFPGFYFSIFPPISLNDCLHPSLVKNGESPLRAACPNSCFKWVVCFITFAEPTPLRDVAYAGYGFKGVPTRACAV